MTATENGVTVAPMKPLLSFSALVVALGLIAPPIHAREVYDLKVYQLKSEEKAALFDRVMEDVGLELAAQSGATTVGVFGEKPGAEDANSATRYVLTVYPSPEAYGKALAREDYDLDVSAHLPYLFADKDGAAFERISSSLYLSFDGFPSLVDPEGDGGAERYFELRTYESPSEGKGLLKVEMFNKAELAIFEKVGLESVFYGHAVAAPNLPQLTYMLVYKDEAAQKAAWDAFRTSPDWEQLKGEERYAGTVSKIQSTLLVALPYSGIR